MKAYKKKVAFSSEGINKLKLLQNILKHCINISYSRKYIYMYICIILKCSE